MSQIYISYSRENRREAMRIRDVLTERGYAVSGGAKAPQAGRERSHPMAGALVMLALYSPSALRSRRLQAETRLAELLGVPVIPILVEPLPAEHGDLSALNAAADFDGAMRTLVTVLDRRSGRTTDDSGASPPVKANTRNHLLAAGLAALIVLLVLVGALVLIQPQPDPEIEIVELPSLETPTPLQSVGEPTATLPPTLQTALPETTEEATAALSATPTLTATATPSAAPESTDEAQPGTQIAQTPLLTAAFRPDPLQGPVPLQVNFIDESTGPIVRYEWDFNGDGSLDATGSNPGPQTFSTIGVHNIVLTVYDAAGNSETANRNISVFDPNSGGGGGVVDDGEVRAAFSMSRISGPAPLQVTFTDSSTGTITSYAWDFNGDGVTDSTAKAPPAYTYTNPGTFQPRLTVSGPDGDNSTTKVVTVGAGGSTPPQADFALSRSQGSVGTSITFTDRSTGTITSYAWDFNGDGTTDSTQPSASYTYQTAGFFNATLTVTGPGGSNSRSTLITISNDQPVADFIANPTSGSVPLRVFLLNTSSGQITQYMWDFNDDGFPDSTIANPGERTYSIPGQYVISLTVRGPSGTSSPKRVTINVTEATSFQVMASASPTQGTAPLQVQFSATASGGATISSYAWDFNGDGTVDSTAPAPQHTYTTAGTYQARLTAQDASGRSSESTVPVTVQGGGGGGAKAVFQARPTQGPAPLQVTFINESTGNITGYEWDFNNDGTVDSTEEDPPAFTYQQPGNYTAKLTLITANNRRSATTEIQVLAAAPDAQFTATPTSGAAPLQVSFTNQSTGTITRYEWDFNGDGVIDSTQQQPQPYTYTQPGTYEARLQVTGPGGTDSFTLPITANGGELRARFDASAVQGPAPLIVNFTNTSTPADAITAYAWDFNGDGTIDSTAAAPPPYTYATAGTYNAALTVTGAGDATNTHTVTITVSEAPPVDLQASFTVDAQSGPAPLTLTFTNTSTPADAITAYAWDFDGDGVTDSTDIDPPPQYTYSTAGTYNAALTVTGPGDATDTHIVTITVSEAPSVDLQANFTVDAQSGPAPLTVTFTNSSTPAEGITVYAWDFDGDGVTDSTDIDPPPQYTYSTAGTYNAALTVTGPGDATDTHTVTITVSEAPPIDLQASFTVDTQSGPAPLLVTFTNSSTPAEGITVYAWDFDGDGVTDSTVIDPAPQYLYQTAGTYNATLTVKSPDGATDTQTVPVTVDPAGPAGTSIASFRVMPDSGAAPLQVILTNESVGTVTGYLWDFESDGVIDSTDASPPPVIYDVAGDFVITLIAIGADGYSLPATQTVRVLPELEVIPPPLP